ncbi:N-myc-interactor [Dryobates pubescens]|uniref:N-myc-interactor n=1 Tax=Dryobates pubescens TaxID=118200 RepID=UPI0023B8CD75|nr:N-myc-interactor [Dryobates pubescens]
MAKCFIQLQRTVIAPDPCDTSKEEMEVLKEELKKWKERVQRAEKAKADLILSKKLADEEYAKELARVKDLEEKKQKDIVMSRETHEQQLRLINQENAGLKREIEQLQEDLVKHTSLLPQSTQLKKKVAEVKMKFSHMDDKKDDCVDMNTHCYFTVMTKIAFRLDQNQALITFQDEEVAQMLVNKGKHTVILDNKPVEVTAQPVPLDKAIRVELHVTISGKEINVSDIPDLSIPDDWMRDKLELNFYKAGKGAAGEVKDVAYDRQSRTAAITFCKPGAAQSFVRCTEYPLFVNGRFFWLSVSPSTTMHSDKCQVYRGVSKKTLLLQGIPGIDEEDEESIQDMVEIHFQRPSNGGGEIEAIKYVLNRATWVCFEEDN